MPPDVALRVYEQHQGFYDKLQQDVAKAAGRASLEDPDAVLATLAVQGGRVQSIAKRMRAAVILISGCQDNQTALDGDHNGAFTGQLRRIWNNGKFVGNHAQFHAQIVAGMPASQTPNLFVLGPAGAFAARKPFEA
jgi:metacaspase-1